MSNYIPITLIGFGIAGQVLLSYILDTVASYKVGIIDPDFLGGDLVRHYGGIHSNTTIGQKIQVLSKLPGNWSNTINSLKGRGDLTATLMLADLVTDLKKTTLPLARTCECIYDQVQKAVWNDDTKQWSLFLKSGKVYTTSIICFSTGMSSRQEDYGIPIIPLSIALDKGQLGRMVSLEQHVLVVGSAHSATLILKNLNELPITRVTCMYRGTKPFKFARDGEYGGIKEESAIIADSIMKGTYTGLTLISTTDMRAVAKACRNADWIIQATGFESVFPCIMNKDTIVTPTWNATNGLATELPQVQAYGACVPNVTTIGSKNYADISLGSFVDQMEIRWPLLKSMIQSQNI